MSRKTEYNNRYNKEHYDRINMFMPKGYKEQIKSKADEFEIGLSEYIFTLICNDLSGVSANISDQKKMAYIQSVCKRDINDSTGTNKVEFKNVAELRAVMKLTHQK